MPRKAEWPPKIRRTRNSARVRIQGKDYYLGVYGSDEAAEAYRMLIAQFEQQNHTPTCPATSPFVTVAAVCDQFLAHHEQTRGRNRELQNYADAIRPLIRLYGDLPAADFGCTELEKVQLALASGDWMTSEERERRQKRNQPIGVCRNVANHRIRRIRTIWRFAEKRRLVPPGNWQHLKAVDPIPIGSPVARDTSRVQPTNFKDLLAVVRCCPFPVGHMLLFQWWTGMRTGEIRHLKWNEIQDGKIVLTHHKTAKLGHARVIPLGPRARAVLEACRRKGGFYVDVNHKPLSGMDSTYVDGYVFQPVKKKIHDYYTRAAFKTVLGRACAKAGVKIRPYGSRHAAKLRIARIAGPEAARHVLGHKSSRQTDHYGGFDLELAEKAMREAG